MQLLLELLIYGIVAVLMLFILAGAVTLFVGLRRARSRDALARAEEAAAIAQPADSGQQRADDGPGGLRGGLHRYVGPVEPKHALLNPPGRVGIEAFAGLFGFPGLGWLISGKVVTGLVLLILGPSFIWGFFPVYLIATEKMVDYPYLFIQYLPLVSVASATALAVYHVRLGRSRAEAAMRGSRGEGRLEAPH